MTRSADGAPGSRSREAAGRSSPAISGRYVRPTKSFRAEARAAPIGPADGESGTQFRHRLAYGIPPANSGLSADGIDKNSVRRGGQLPPRIAYSGDGANVPGVRDGRSRREPSTAPRVCYTHAHLRLVATRTGSGRRPGVTVRSVCRRARSPGRSGRRSDSARWRSSRRERGPRAPVGRRPDRGRRAALRGPQGRPSLRAGAVPIRSCPPMQPHRGQGSAPESATANSQVQP